MNAKISVGIVGYGNVGRGVELALRQNPDMQLAAVVTRRDPASLKLATPGVAVVRESEIASLKGKSVSQRAASLIDIAHPDHRERLSREARDAGLLPRTVH